MIYAIFLVSMIVAPYAVLKAYEFHKRKKERRWSGDDAEVVDNWKYPSNYM